jgi:integrase
MGNDVFNHQQKFDLWKQDVLDSKGKPNKLYIEENLTLQNSQIYIQYILDMEQGSNIHSKSKKGGRDPKTLNRLRSKIKSIFKQLQERGVKDVTKINEAQIKDFFNEWVKQGHSTDYAKRFRSFWNWWLKINRKQGKTIPDICEELDTAPNNDSQFVWITKEELEDFRKYFNEDPQLVILFCYDSIIRSPGELLGLKVENIFTKGKEVWVDIPNEISKTYGRKFNLVYCGDLILKHIQDKKPTEPLFNFNSAAFNRQLQKVAKQLWGEKKSLGGAKYKDITLYDMRHSGAIHYRQLFQKTGQSLDSLRHRGGWTDFRMINYYTKFLGLDGHIDKEKTLLQEDKSSLEKELIEMQKRITLLENPDELAATILKTLQKKGGSKSAEAILRAIKG